MKNIRRIKICGITRREDAELSIELGAWAIGFVFAGASPRRVTLEDVKPLLRGLPDSVLKVGVFVDATLAEVRAAADVGITVAQFHGLVPPEVLVAPPIPYFIARAPSSPTDLEDLGRFSGADALLIDGHVPGKFGGTGVQANWGLAIMARAHHPRIILAGGIRAENVRTAISTVRPYAVDASSGLEAAYGVKDPKKLREFFKEAAREI